MDVTELRIELNRVQLANPMLTTVQAFNIAYARLKERAASAPGPVFASLNADATERSRRTGETFEVAFSELLTPERYAEIERERRGGIAAETDDAA